jgi:hypothetical protein
MSVRQITMPFAGDAPAVLSLPQPMTPEALGRSERQIAGTLSEPRREVDAGAADRGRLEYESWIALLRERRA